MAVRLIGALADPVAGRVVIADPDLAPGIACDGASDLFGSGPDELRVVAADLAARVGRVVVIERFRIPLVDHSCWRGGRTGYFKHVLAVRRTGTVDKSLFGEQPIGPPLRFIGQSIG